MAAARRIDKIAPKLVAEYLLKYANAQVRPSMRGSRFPMGRISPITKNPPERSEQTPRGPSVFQRRLTQLVRDETGNGRAIVDFMVGVMHGAITGFKPYHRMEAAKELASYVTHTPSPLTGEGWGEGDPSIVPAKSLTHTRHGAGTQKDGAGRTPSVVPEQSVTHPRPQEPALSSSKGQLSADQVPFAERLSVAEGSPSQSSQSPNHANPGSDNPRLPTKNQKLKTKNSPRPISRKELEQDNFDSRHVARYTFARDEITAAIYAFDGLGPLVVDEDGVPHSISPDRIVGYDHASLMHEHRTRPDPNSPIGPVLPSVVPALPSVGPVLPSVIPVKTGTHPRPPSPAQNQKPETRNQKTPPAPPSGRRRQGPDAP